MAAALISYCISFDMIKGAKSMWTLERSSYTRLQFQSSWGLLLHDVPLLPSPSLSLHSLSAV